MKIQYKILILVIFFLLFTSITPLFAAKVVLEVGIPGQTGAEPGATVPELTDYMKYIYWFMLGTVGIAAFISLVWYGILWIYSGIVEKKSEALEGIKNTFLGLGLAFGAYILLRTINPDLVSFTAPGAPVPSVTTATSTSTTLTTPVPSAPKKSPTDLKGLASAIPSSFISETRSPETKTNIYINWNQCNALDNKTKVTVKIVPFYTLEQIKNGELATTCRSGCSDTTNKSTAYCVDLKSISPDMMQGIWNATHIVGTQPEFSIVEIVGGDRKDNNNVRAHYAGRAIDVIPKTGTTGNDYKKIISAFSNSGATKIICVNEDETEDVDNPACNDVLGIDHLHIEW